MKVAYIDCFSGISGDMFLGALLDAGLPIEELKQRLQTLPLDGYHLNIKREQRNRISGTRFCVRLEPDIQPPRNLESIRRIIREGGLSHTVRDKSIEIFERIAEIEGKIHDLPPEDVHFHELGAADSIIDIVGVLIGIECLKIGPIYASRIPLGSGFAKTSHGMIPIPAPATIELLKGVPVYDSGIPHEMVTPTGAALIKCLARSFGPMPPMIIQDVGYGVGKRDFPEQPNLLRVLIGEDRPHQEVEAIVSLETNIDNTSPEWMGYLMERLFDTGALDVVFFPIQMKKNRPGVQIQVMGRADQRDALMEILFRESATLGVRFQYEQRQVLQRSESEVESPWGKIKVKKIMNRDGSSFFQPEYDVCREIALRHHLPLRKIYHWIMGLNK